MTREVHLSSLTVGRCFRLPKPPSVAEGATPGAVITARSVMAPEHVWKVCEAGFEVIAENAAGKRKGFPATTKVVELPREGFERLASR